MDDLGDLREGAGIAAFAQVLDSSIQLCVAQDALFRGRRGEMKPADEADGKLRDDAVDHHSGSDAGAAPSAPSVLDEERVHQGLELGVVGDQVVLESRVGTAAQGTAHLLEEGIAEVEADEGDVGDRLGHRVRLTAVDGVDGAAWDEDGVSVPRPAPNRGEGDEELHALVTVAVGQHTDRPAAHDHGQVVRPEEPQVGVVSDELAERRPGAGDLLGEVVLHRVIPPRCVSCRIGILGKR